MASATDDYAPPQPKPSSFQQRWNDFQLFIWNPAKREFFGRTGLSWAKISFFYLIFYCCLAAFFAMCLGLFFLTVSEDFPKLQDDENLLAENPGMGFRPMPDYQTTLIRFEQGKPSSYKPFTDQLQAFLEQYDPGRVSGEELEDCQDDNKQSPRGVCKFDTTTVLGDVCTRQKDFGYDLGLPCVLLKLNKIYNWEPELYQHTNESSSLEDAVGGRFHADYVGVSCHGENPADKEYIGPLEYFPKHGFHKKFFPFLNQRGYRQPVVFVKFKKPKEGQVIQVTCKAWAKNIKTGDRLIDSVHRQGSVHFEILVD